MTDTSLVLNDTVFGHSLEDRPTTEWQRLDHHLSQVAELAGQFASQFGAGLARGAAEQPLETA